MSIEAPGEVTASRRAVRMAALAILVLAIVFGAQVLRTRLGLALSVDAVQAWASSLGWAAPMAFLGLVACRQLVLLPALLVLTAGGLVFGSALGAVLGGTGLVVSSLANFACARYSGPTILPERLRARVRRGSTQGHGMLLLFVTLATAHPTGPLMLAHWTAGCSTVPAGKFLLVVGPTSYVRAGALSVFGAGLTAWGSPESIALTAGMTGLVLLPLFSSRVRRSMFGTPSIAHEHGGTRERSSSS